jgi:hypothetical protein
MAVISPNSFDPLKRYVGVRLQQGVPIVDRDWNEMEDILAFELRTILKWFIGNGVPENSDAFLIVGFGATDDFTITGGGSDGLNAGRCLVDGRGVFNPASLNFKAQPLHQSQPNAATLATAWNVPTITLPAPLPAPNNIQAVYLDVWERLVTPSEDPTLVLPGLGTESCARVKREWAVRVRNGTTVPVPGNPDFLGDARGEISHSYYLLATIVRGPAINATDVTDRRQTRLTLAALATRLQTLERVVLFPAFVPSPNQFTPKLGAPGTSVTLSGNNFNVGTTTVRFGTVVAAITGTPTDNQIVTTVPSMPPGQVRITVETSSGSILSDDVFTVLPPPTPSFSPSPNQFTPKLGAPGTNITLNGSNFDIGTTTVRFGSVIAPLVITSGNLIVARVPTMPAGNVQITVQTGSGSVTSVDIFRVLPATYYGAGGAIGGGIL